MLGFTFDEKILNETSLEEFMMPLEGLFSQLEIAPDLSLLSFETYKKIVEYSTSHHFHVPYFVPDKQYQFDGAYKHDFERFFTIVDKLRQHSIKSPSIVLHGTTHDQTLSGLDYLLNFIERKKIDVILTLENTDDRLNIDEIAKMVHIFNTDRLKICYDLAHDFYGLNLGHQAYSDLIHYIHVHGKKTIKHQSIQHLPSDIIMSLPRDVDINLEVLLSPGTDYKTIIKKDLEILKSSLW